MRNELTSVRHTHTREKSTLSEQLEEMKTMATLTQTQTKSEKVRSGLACLQTRAVNIVCALSHYN